MSYSEKNSYSMSIESGPHPTPPEAKRVTPPPRNITPEVNRAGSMKALSPDQVGLTRRDLINATEATKRGPEQAGSRRALAPEAVGMTPEQRAQAEQRQAPRGQEKPVAGTNPVQEMKAIDARKANNAIARARNAVLKLFKK